MKRVLGIVGINVSAWFLVSAQIVSAQAADQKVIDLNGQAMEAYNNLDVNRAVTLLEQALAAAQKGAITSGPIISGTYLNLGIVQVGGLNNKESGFEQFVRAVCYVPSIQIDPIVSTPEIMAVFQQAQQSAASGNCTAVGIVPPAAQATMPGISPAQAAQPSGPPAAATGSLQILHQPPSPQLAQAPLPLYAEVPGITPDNKVYLYYLGLSMDSFKRVEMMPLGSGFAYQITCREVWEPKVRYYLAVSDSEGRIIATAGSAQAPYEAAVAAALQGPGPSLPGGSSPGPCQDVECPPGIVGDACEKPLYHAIGQGCERDNDCQPGLSCKSDMCTIPGAGGHQDDWAVNDGWTPPERLGNFARAFLQVGLASGFSWLSAGKVTDSAPPIGTDIYTTSGQFNPNSAWIPDGDSYEIPPNRGIVPAQDVVRNYGKQIPASQRFSADCPADGIPSAWPDAPSRYCAYVGKTGMVYSPALRVTAGYFVFPRLSLAGVFRLQFSHGTTSLAGILLGGRAEFMILKPREKGFMLSFFAGGTVGQIQVKPPPRLAGQQVPYIISGLGGAHVGVTARYRFLKYVGVFVSPELDFQFPDPLTHFDLTIGPEGSF